MTESEAVKLAILRYVTAIENPKVQSRILQGVELARESNFRSLTASEYAAMSGVTKHLTRLTKKCEEAARAARRSQATKAR